MAFTTWYDDLNFSNYKRSEGATFPIIYLTGHTNYNGILTDENEVSEPTLWRELIECDSISAVLISWQQRIIQPKSSSVKRIELLQKIIPFRMVLHRAHRMKVAHGYDETMGKVEKFKSRCAYFAMLWVPSNSIDGMNGAEYDQLIAAMNQSKYFCKKLNKECIYISGPKYGDDECDEEHKFNLDHLHSKCKKFSNDSKNPLDIPYDKQLNIQIVVHEMCREKMDPKAFEFDVFRNERSIPSFTKLPSISSAINRADTSILRKRKSSKPARPPNVSNVSINYSDVVSPMSDAGHYASLCSCFCPSRSLRRGATMGIMEELELNVASVITKEETVPDELDINHRANRDSHTFAFVWFEIEDRTPANSKQQSRSEYSQRLTISSYRQPSKSKSAANGLMGDIEEEKAFELEDMSGYHHSPMDEENDEDEDNRLNGVFPALSVMYRLHQQPCGDSKAGLMNVELMGYDECYQNLNLTVDRNRPGYSWSDSFIISALLVIFQCIFLPFCVLIPPISIIRCFRPKFKITPRYRPSGALSDPFEDLDRTEQIPYDITAIWRSYRFDKSRSLIAICRRKFFEFILSTLLTLIAFTGPFLYHYDERTAVTHMGFFDCFGPAIFYGLGVCTIICWSSTCRALIGPKEHLLLYNKLIAQRPAKNKKPSTDYAALTYLSQHIMMTAISYAQRKSFLEVRTPTHELISKRVFRIRWNDPEKCLKFGKWILFAMMIIIYCAAQNLENIQTNHYPFYVENNDFVKHWCFRQIYCVVSNVTSWILLLHFIFLWETMISRISRQHDNVRNITNLIVRNTYSEYICFDYTDNIITWVILGDFIKRKGMMLFASLETPVFSLFLLCFLSWSGTIYCIFGGVGLEWKTQNSLFSNSALATWFFLAVLSCLQVARLLWYGHKFNQESEKQNNALRTQCNTLHNGNLMQFLKHDKLSIEQTYAIQSSQILLTHLKDHNEIVPRVFGIKFDKLTAKAVWTAVASAVPTMFTFVLNKMNSNGN